MRTTNTTTAALACAALAMAPDALAGGKGEGVLYELRFWSTYASHCYAPCDCAGLYLELTGTFRLTAIEVTPTFERYEISDVDWLIGGQDGAIATGYGTYERFLDKATSHRLQLQIDIGGTETIYYDDGFVDGGGAFPRIDASASRYEMDCYDEEFIFHAEPKGACVGDADGDGTIGFGDLLAVLAGWGPCGVCPADVNGSGFVDFADLLVVLSAWGGC